MLGLPGGRDRVAMVDVGLTMRPAFLALILFAGAAASIAMPARCVRRPVLRYGRGGRFSTPEGAVFHWLMERR